MITSTKLCSSIASCRGQMPAMLHLPAEVILQPSQALRKTRSSSTTSRRIPRCGIHPQHRWQMALCLGGFRAAGAPGGSADSWQWVTGEAWNHTAWAPGEPNNNPNDLQGLAYWSLQGPASTWFDHTASDPVSRALIVEYPVPAPAAAAFVLLCGIMPRRRMR